MERTRGNWLWWAVAALLMGFAALHLLRGGAAPAEPAPVSVAPRAPSEPRTVARLLYVHVAGRVRRPGLYRLGAGARVASAIDRAGGPARRADLTKVNLAARLEDGQQIVVPRVGAVAAAAAGPAAAGGAPGAPPGAKLSLASATAEQLDGLDGIGPTLAKRIVEYREAHGGFRSIGQLRDVEGIGEKRFESLRKAVGP
jgi:competence protein ComEA